jgi:Tol biopolymer transport system component/DNA-binding winged helix-turn-helix (wHTH) protein
MKEAREHFYEFEDFRLGRESMVLFRGNSIVDITPKSRELLRVLLENSGEIVRKEELLAQVWPDSFVEEANLSHHIYRLRRALGEESTGGKFIETVPKRGYRFIAPVVETLSSSAVAHNASLINGDVPRPASSMEHRRPVGKAWLAATVLAVAASAALATYWFVVSGRTNTDAKKAKALRMETVPLTSFANDEFDSALSPDGRYVAFVWMGPENESLQIYVKQTDAGEPLKLSTNATIDRDGAPAWSPDGRFIAFTRLTTDHVRGGIYMVPSFGGPERRLLKAEPLGAGLDWSPDGKTIVFSSKESPDDPFALYLLDLETLETRRLTSPPVQSEGDGRPDFSPSGETISFNRQLQESGDLYLTDLSGSTRRLTSDNRAVIGAAWAPDGKSIIYSSNRGGSFALWRLTMVDGVEPEPLPINADRAFDPSISRTGNRLTFTYIQRDTNIWRIPAARNNRRAASEQLIGSSRRELAPNYSPDGSQIAYSSDVSGSSEIWLSTSAGTNAIQLTRFGGGLTVNPRWSPDGNTIVFEAHPEGFSHLYSISRNGGAPKQLTSGNTNSTAASFSADGRWIYYGSDINGGWDIWKIPASGGDAVRVTKNGGYEAFESSDGSTLYFIKFRVPGIFKVDPAGSLNETLLVPEQNFEAAGEWTVGPDGIYIAQHHYEPKDKKPRIDFFSFETGKIEKIAELEKDIGTFPGLDLSPDGQWLIYSREDLRNHDISLVENFR